MAVTNAVKKWPSHSVFLILTLLSATNAVPVRRRKEGSTSILECFHWEGEGRYISFTGLFVL